MAGGFVDLHAHSTGSDGTLSPAELVRLASASGLSAIALTDHDTASGVEEAAAEARRIGIDFIGGIEISAVPPGSGALHILGFGIDPTAPALVELSRQQIEARNTRNPRIIAKLNQLGVAISLDEVHQEVEQLRAVPGGAAGGEAGGEADGSGVVGRPHIAAVLVRKGYASSIKNAFDKYLAQGAAAYVDRERLAPRRAIEMIHRSNGVAVLAHPVQLRTENDARLERIVKDLVDLGLDGLEVIHSDHGPAEVEKFKRLAERHRLVKTGGSDFHGSRKKDIALGVANGLRIPREYFDFLRARIGEKSSKALHA
jgi:hypothetical protein